MYGFAFVCGWAVTGALIALVWINSRPDRRLPIGLLLGALAGVLWPITLWIAAGAWLLRRASLRAANSVDAASLEAQSREAEAFARQATLESMPSSAAYWRAEAQRLTAQREAAGTASARPPSTGRIVLGCTVASLATIGVIGLTAPPASVVDTAGSGGPVAAPPRMEAPQPQQPSVDRSDQPERTALGNIAKQYGEAASVLSPTGEPVVEFVAGQPGPAQCNAFAGDPENGRFIALPMSVRTHDDPTDILVFTTFGSPWEFVGIDGRSVEVSSSAAAMCAYEAPAQLGPNRTYEFSVVLDVPAEPGVLVLRSPADRGGWEWPYQG